jgi:hypothetical protein
MRGALIECVCLPKIKVGKRGGTWHYTIVASLLLIKLSHAIMFYHTQEGYKARKTSTVQT